MLFVSNWLGENCGSQVSISYYSDIVHYLQCRDEGVKNQFINVSVCFFNGHIVKFIKWHPNFKLDSLDFMCPIWVNIQSLPPELNHIEILKSLGFGLGELLNIHSSYQYDNNVKFLIKTK